MSRRAASLALAGVLCLPAACEHAQPFRAADLGPNVPFSQGLPRQLTFGPLGDLAPAWLPDGYGVLYSFQRLDDAHHDRCLGVLPAEGGQRIRTICHASAFTADSTTTLWEPAAGPAGLLAYVRESSRPGALVPRSRELVVASLDAPDPGRPVRSFPYVAPSGALHETAAYVHWVNDSTLVYLAEHVSYLLPPAAPGPETLYAPVEVAFLTLGQNSSAVAVVPGTANATSVTADSSGAIYYTLAGDSRVYRIVPGGGGAGILFDFGALGPAGDVQVQGTTLVAVVGGALYRQDLAGAFAVRGSLAIDALRFARPALSPSGARVVTEARRSRAADLWLLQVP
jgi:hypothetical protein